MLKGFETVTYDITEFELNTLVPAIVSIIKEHKGIDNAITSKLFISKLAEQGLTIKDVRLRKCIKHIQLTNRVKWIVANQAGFFYTTDKSDIKNQIHSLLGREKAIQEVRTVFERSLAEAV